MRGEYYDASLVILPRPNTLDVRLPSE